MRSSTGNVKKIRLNNKEARGAWRQSTLQGSEAAGGQGCFSTAAARRQNPLQLVDNQCGGGGRNRTEVTDSDTKKIAGFIGASSRICANSLTTFPNSASARTDSFTDSRSVGRAHGYRYASLLDPPPSLSHWPLETQDERAGHFHGGGKTPFLAQLGQPVPLHFGQRSQGLAALLHRCV